MKRIVIGLAALLLFCSAVSMDLFSQVNAIVLYPARYGRDMFAGFSMYSRDVCAFRPGRSIAQIQSKPTVAVRRHIELDQSVALVSGRF